MLLYTNLCLDSSVCIVVAQTSGCRKSTFHLTQHSFSAAGDKQMCSSDQTKLGVFSKLTHSVRAPSREAIACR